MSNVKDKKVSPGAQGCCGAVIPALSGLYFKTWRSATASSKARHRPLARRGLVLAVPTRSPWYWFWRHRATYARPMIRPSCASLSNPWSVSTVSASMRGLINLSTATSVSHFRLQDYRYLPDIPKTSTVCAYEPSWSFPESAQSPLGPAVRIRPTGAACAMAGEGAAKPGV